MIAHTRTRCVQCGTTILECRTLAQCRDRATQKEDVAVSHDTHLRMLEAMRLTREEAKA